MISCPNLLIIGAADRNVGKTEFACQLIRRQAATYPVFGIKVTIAGEPAGAHALEGGSGGERTSSPSSCGIVEESRAEGGKDTARMLRAGAQRVWWLRVSRDRIEEGLGSVLKRVPAGALVVCESNSARTVLEPGLFLIVRRAGATSMKPSCRAVLAYADRVVEFHGDGWDLQPDQIAVVGHRWILRPTPRP